MFNNKNSDKIVYRKSDISLIMDIKICLYQNKKIIFLIILKFHSECILDLNW